MGEKQSKNMLHIKSLMQLMALDEDKAVRKTELILKTYQPVVWATKERSWDLRFEAKCLGGQELGKALDYLSEYAPETDKKRFQNNVSSLFRTSWLLEIVDAAMRVVYDYPRDGELYFELLTKKYLVYSAYSEVQLLDILSISRSTYFEKKKEAIYLLALVLWGHTVPECKINQESIGIKTYA